MKTIFFTLIATLIAVFNVYSQSLSDARKAFDRYDYELAAEYFSNIFESEKQLNLEDLKRITYSYYVIGDYEKCKPFSDSLLRKKKLEEMFYLINGDVNRGLSNYVKAIESYELYLSAGGKEDVSLKIESCREIPNWDNEKFVDFKEKEHNTRMADFVDGVSPHGIVSFSEGGVNYEKDKLDLKTIGGSSDAELLMSVPYFINFDEISEVKLVDSNYASVTSMSFMPDAENAIVTVSYPLEKSPLLKVPNLYWAKYDDVKRKLTDLRPFDYIGLLDSSSTAHATINESGNKMVFTKMNKNATTSNLYFTELINDMWTQPQFLAGINTHQNELYPLFSGDSILTFSSDGRLGYGELDIYSAVFEGLETNKITHLKAPINSAKDDFNMTYMSPDSALFSSNRIGGTGDDDVYFIKFRNAEELVVDTFDIQDYVADWKVKSVYFEFDKFNLNKALSDENIKDIKFILAEEPDCKIELIGYTDSRGPDAYNLQLSQRRAESVQEVLSKQGVSTDQIEITPMGETNLPNDCGAKCSQEGHKLNRVVQIRLKCD